MTKKKSDLNVGELFYLGGNSFILTNCYDNYRYLVLED